MSVLSGIKESVQQVAEAISIAVGLEVEIVDNKLRILGGTGYYHGPDRKKKRKTGIWRVITCMPAYCVRGRLSMLKTRRIIRDMICPS